jgi:ribonuclease HII
MFPGMQPNENETLVAGVDEAGRGCLAGPVVAAAVILPLDAENLSGLADSKKLSSVQRERLEPLIKAAALSWALGLAWPREIERINILQASLQAMARAVAKLKTRPELVLADGNQKPPLCMPCRTVVGGDALIPCISAASILAKTFRDRLMVGLDRRYSGYGLARHKGYGTAEHREKIRTMGPCPMHRMTFQGVRDDGRERRICLPI